MRTSFSPTHQTAPSVTASAVLGTAASGTRWPELPATVRERAFDVFVDTLAVMAAGSDREAHTSLGGLLARGTSGGATVIGSPTGASASDAAFLNATLPTVYQLDEGYRPSRGHPAIHVAPVVLALAEQTDASVCTAMSAFVAGYEVASRIGTAMNGTRPQIHPHGNWGAVGAAVAAAHLLSGADAGVISAAIDIASGVAGFPDRRAATAGAGVHHLWAAIGAHTGLIAGTSAVAGLTPVVGALESYLLPQSSLAPDASALTAGIDTQSGGWSDYAIASGYVKFWAACGHTHTAIGAILAILERDPVDAAEVEAVEVTTFQAAASLAEREPRTELAARFSIPAVVAAAILDRRFGIDSLREDRLQSPELKSLASRIRVSHDPACDDGYPAQGRPLRMVVRLSGGRRLEQEMSLSHGDPEQPASREDMRVKALSLFVHRFGEVDGARVLDAATGLEHAESFTSLTAALRSAAKGKVR